MGRIPHARLHGCMGGYCREGIKMDMSLSRNLVQGSPGEALALHREARASRDAGRDVLLLTLGDPDLDTPPAIVEAAVQAMRGGDTRYVECGGRPMLRKAIARVHGTQVGRETSPDEVVVCSGAQGALLATCLSLFGPGDEVLVPDPAFLSYVSTVSLSGARPVRVSGLQGRFDPDPASLALAITPRTRGIVLASPGNPAGNVPSPAVVAEIALLARRHDLWIISDEVYSTMTYGRTHVPWPRYREWTDAP